MTYLIDSDVFIQAKNLHYGFDICPAFWAWLEASNAAGEVFSVERIGGELTAGQDELAAWARARGSAFFLLPDAAVLAAFARLSAWAAGSHYDADAKAEFLASGEYYLIAHALAHGGTVVSHEQPSNSLKKIKVPDACAGVGQMYNVNISCVGPFKMLRDSGATFVLPAPAAAAALALPAGAGAAMAVGPGASGGDGADQAGAALV